MTTVITPDTATQESSYTSTACLRGNCPNCPGHEKGYPDAVCQCTRCDHTGMAGAPTRWENEYRFGVGRHGYHHLSGARARTASLAGLGVRLDLVRGALQAAGLPDTPKARERVALHIAGAYREQGSVVAPPRIKLGNA